MFSRIASISVCLFLAACATAPTAPTGPTSPVRPPNPLAPAHGMAVGAGSDADAAASSPSTTLSESPDVDRKKDVTLTSSFDSPPVIVRVADVGAGLCVVARTADGYTLLIDAAKGHRHCLRAIDQVLRPDEPLDLVILTHADLDHFGGLAGIAQERAIGQLLWNGRWPVGCAGGKSCTFRENLAAVAEGGASIINFATHPHRSGDTFPLGEFLNVVLLATHTRGPWEDDVGLPDSEAINAASIVVRLDIAERRILIPGDALGRRDGSGPQDCLLAEAWLVEEWGSDLKSDVLVAGHHGADDASSPCFLEAVDPRYVVIPAGSQYSHPLASAVERMLQSGVQRKHVFRTDRGSGALQPGEWPQEPGLECGDESGDDDVLITLSAGGRLRIAHATPDRCTE